MLYVLLDYDINTVKQKANRAKIEKKTGNEIGEKENAQSIDREKLCVRRHRLHAELKH